MTVAVLSALMRPLLEERLPREIEPRWFASVDELHRLAPEAEIGWFDMEDFAAMGEAIRLAERMRWFNSVFSGLDTLPVHLLAERNVTVTHGAGINADAVADYAVMGMLVVAKDYRKVVESQQRGEWLPQPPARGELRGTRALILGYGAIGQAIAARLQPFGVECVPVRRSAADGALGPDEWRARLADFDWVVLAVPATRETENMLGAAEFSAMKASAVLVNVARGDVVDQDALIAALRERAIAAAFLDVTDPEPLPAGHPLWELENAHITSHLSGRSQSSMFARAADRFLANAHRFVAGEPMEPLFDTQAGY